MNKIDELATKLEKYRECTDEFDQVSIVITSDDGIVEASIVVGIDTYIYTTSGKALDICIGKIRDVLQKKSIMQLKEEYYSESEHRS